MIPSFAFGWLMVLTVMLGGSSGMPETLPPELEGVPRQWLVNQWKDLESEAHLIIEAYELKGDLLEMFWHDYYSQWAEQYFYETAYLSEPTEGVPGDEMMRRLGEFAAHMPTNPETLGLLAESLLPAGDHTRQRRRLEELRFRRDQRTWLHEDQVVRKDRLAREAKRLRLIRVNLTEHGHPMPMWVHARGQQEIAARIGREHERDAARRQEARRKARRDPGGSAVRRLPPESAKPGPAQAEEPLVDAGFDDTLRAWRGYLGKIEADQGLDGRGRARVENTFSRMWKRARAYRATRRAAYADLEKIRSRRIFSERLAGLDAPLRPLFEEFKLRVDRQARGAR